MESPAPGDRGEDAELLLVVVVVWARLNAALRGWAPARRRGINTEEGGFEVLGRRGRGRRRGVARPPGCSAWKLWPVDVVAAVSRWFVVAPEVELEVTHGGVAWE